MMKSSLLLTACTALSLLAGCDSGSSTAPVETKVVRDTVWLYRNDRFAKNDKIANGRWILRSDKDSADMWIFQDSSKVEALVQWTKSTSWSVKGTRNDAGWNLLSKDNQIELLLKITEEKDDKVSKMNVNVWNRATSDMYTATLERRL
ncbi:MAG: hypothetical protein IPO40_10265 [Fibrobacteres bacterium]|nr:hypothetical protein [Fibrobacterota bacterium]